MKADPLPIAALRAGAESVGLPWREPEQWDDPEDGPQADWWGNGPQGSEPARLLMTTDEDGTVATLVTTSGPGLREWERTDHVASYREFLRLNGWWSG